MIKNIYSNMNDLELTNEFAELERKCELNKFNSRKLAISFLNKRNFCKSEIIRRQQIKGE